MKAYYSRTFVALAVVLLTLVGAAVAAGSAAAAAAKRYSRLLETEKLEVRRIGSARARLERLESATEPVRRFAAAWSSHAQVPAKGGAEQIRSAMEAIAQRRLGLVTDDAITPRPDRYLFQGDWTKVQRVTLRASGKDLTALVTWLGKVEEAFPSAIIEACEFSSNIGGNTGLMLRLVQPLAEPRAGPPMAESHLPDAALDPANIAALGWSRYTPEKVKASVAVGFERNPLQPAVAAGRQPAPAMRDERDDLSPRLAAALDGRLRCVVRGAVPIVVIDGRVYRVGDELVASTAKNPVPGATIKLKAIGDDRLVFHAAGGTPERPVQRDIEYPLPMFLHAR